MTSFREEDGTLRIPATSPCRRDYQLRSFSSECETSRPQSPWLPRSESRSVQASTFRLYESSSDRSNCYSGPLPAARHGASRSYYSGPLPNASPMPSYFSGAALPDFMTGSSAFRTGAKGCQSGETSSASGRLPEVGTSREGSLRSEEGVLSDVDEVGEVLYTSYLRKEDERSAPRSTSRMASPSPRSGKMRNCVSGELGMRLELAQQRAQTARGYKSGEIAGLELCADGIYPMLDMRSEVEALVKVGREISIRKKMSLESVACEPLNDGENEQPNSELAMVAIPLSDAENQRSSSESAMVAIPFKWEEMPVKRGDFYSRSSSTSRPARITKVASESEICVAKELLCSGRSHRFYGAESDVKRVAPKLEKPSSVSSSVSSAKSKPSSAVPFKWEVEPGKPKVEETPSRSPETPPALQLPPRLKRNSSISSAPPSRRNSITAASENRLRRPSRSLSTSTAEHHSPSPKPRRTLATAFRLDTTARDCTPKRGSPGPIASQFGSPQYRSAEYLCEDSGSWNRVHSPTSTLCGPGSDSHSTPSSSKSSRKSSVTSFSHSQSGTSAESFEQWSYGDHISPTSRHPSIREFPESEANSVRGHEEGDHSDGAMSKLRRKLNLKSSSSSKPPRSPIRSSHAAVDTNGYSSHGEEYFDCQAPSPSSKNVERSDTELEEVEPPTRLPYKMPSPVHDVEPKAASASSSSGSEFSNCLTLPKFLSKGETPYLWVENPSWDLPTTTGEDGYRSPAYKATLELLSPSPNLLSKKKTGSKLPRSSSSRRRHPHLVEVLCNSLKQSLQRCTKRSVARTQSITLYEDQFTKRHQSFMW